MKQATANKIKSKYRNCFECGSPSALTYSHILKKQWYADYEDVDNIVLDCYDCHHIWDNGTFVQKSNMASIEKRMAIIKNLFEKSIGAIKDKVRRRYNTLAYGLNDCGHEFELIEN